MVDLCTDLEPILCSRSIKNTNLVRFKVNLRPTISTGLAVVQRYDCVTKKQLSKIDKFKSGVDKLSEAEQLDIELEYCSDFSLASLPRPGNLIKPKQPQL